MNGSFFDTYPDFVTSTAGAWPRLKARYDCLIAAQRQHIVGKRIIDLGAHNGRWAGAALKAGARHVICLEGRRDLAETGKRLFEQYEIGPECYQWHVGDCLEQLRNNKFKCDTVFVFGIFYHIHNHTDWALEIYNTGANVVIVDTSICKNRDNIILYKTEDADVHLNTPFSTGHDTRAVVGIPSKTFVRFIFRQFGYTVTEIDWSRYLDQPVDKTLGDYVNGRRATFICQLAGA